MPFLNKKFRTYREFAGASMEALFGEEALQKADRRQVSELASCVFLNEGNGRFRKVPLPAMGQASAIYDFLPDDLDLGAFKSVVIYCKAFTVLFSTAELVAP